MLRHYLLFLCALVISVIAVPTGHQYEVHERREYNTDAWTETQRLAGDTILPVRIGLTQSNLDRGHDLLMDISNPKSSRYGKHLSLSEMHDFFAPADTSVAAVRSWLESAGIAGNRISQSTNKQWVQFDANVNELEDLLRTEYYTYSHGANGRSHVSCREYQVPASVREHIDYITPGVAMREVTGLQMPIKKLGTRTFGGIPPKFTPIDRPISQLTSNTSQEWCSLTATPQCIGEMYNIPKGHSATKGNELGIFETLGDVYSQESLDLFFSHFASEIPVGTHPILKGVDGGSAPTTDVKKDGCESNLDFEISYPIIWPQTPILFQTDDMVYETNHKNVGWLNTFLDAIDGSYCDEISPYDPVYPDPAEGGYKGSLQCGVYEPPKVISISYGGMEYFMPLAYQKRQCGEFMKLGTMGVSVVVASGDSGVAGIYGYCLGPNETIFNPDYPATCPYLTAVGSTEIPIGVSHLNHKEQATIRFGSGGGFSNIYKTPDYQAQAVTQYFSVANLSYPYYETSDNTSIDANDGIYNRIGRGYPDVAAIGERVAIYCHGTYGTIGGTSASAPAFAAMLTRINEERLAVGKSTVGFVNPVLYAHPEAFFDVTSGSNAGCGTPGFAAIEGWDPVTGLGTPNYPRLLDVFMKN
ncbi:hypothetical protein MYU51_020039 [Penicillium brevicompactum]|uniref:uncharacterized protein n=1 Tax=Penicillium brevicompactum TaxID=5074 RepID=UPI002540850F|nr:uncharacterized protein N7506_004057 [Penicillium brevicompactum]KAJ5336035.1 hypothetical protein N7506_004057 [Penicillium brevicompactum]